MNLCLEGKRAFVTGGSHGIGKAIALFLANEGCDIIISARSEKNLKETSHDIEERGVRSFPIQSDLSLEKKRQEILDIFEAKDLWPDILINNVGGGGRWGNEDVLKTSTEVWREVIEKNVFSTIDFTIGCLPHMVKNKWGRVIAITSIYGTQIGGRPWFNTSKVAQSTIMSSLAHRSEFARSGITLNSVAPGPIMIPDTGWEVTKHTDPQEFQKYLDSLPSGQLGTPEDIAGIVAFLCSDMARHINGTSISVDGGENVAL